MAGNNITGLAKTRDYQITGGKVFLAPLSGYDVPGDYRFVGNVKGMTINADSEADEHYTAINGPRTKDAEAITDISADFELVIDEINHENLAAFFVGEATTYANIASNISAKAVRLPDPAVSGRQIGGRWYDITSRGVGAIIDAPTNQHAVRAYDLAAETDVVITQDISGTPTTFTGGTDFEVDLTGGMIFIPQGGAFETALIDAATAISGTTEYVSYPLTGANGFQLNITHSSAPTATLDEMRALTTSAQTFAMKLLQLNSHDNNHQTELQIHKVKLRPQGEYNPYSPETYAELTLAGSLEANTGAHSTSGFLTQRTVRV